MADRPKAYEQTLRQTGDTYTFEIKPNRGADSFQPINTNGSQRGGRPLVAYLPQRLTDVRIIAGAELSPVVTDDFILVPNPCVCDPARQYRVVFQARRL
jgi:zinc protease